VNIRNFESNQKVTSVFDSTVLLTMVQVLYLLEVFILVHYGPPSTETPTTVTTTVRCHKYNWIYLSNKYLLLV